MASHATRLTVPRPALRHLGAKWRLAPWIQQDFPTHVCYVEPYASSVGDWNRIDHLLGNQRHNPWRAELVDQGLSHRH
jgi:hypothetical protein